MSEEAAFKALRPVRVEIDPLQNMDRGSHVRDCNERKRIRAYQW